MELGHKAVTLKEHQGCGKSNIRRNYAIRQNGEMSTRTRVSIVQSNNLLRGKAPITWTELVFQSADPKSSHFLPNLTPPSMTQTSSDSILSSPHMCLTSVRHLLFVCQCVQLYSSLSPLALWTMCSARLCMWFNPFNSKTRRTNTNKWLSSKVHRAQKEIQCLIFSCIFSAAYSCKKRSSFACWLLLTSV